ncbi:MAG: mechanosensitive ion channel family protein [Maritimibacter sp.]
MTRLTLRQLRAFLGAVLLVIMSTGLSVGTGFSQVLSVADVTPGAGTNSPAAELAATVELPANAPDYEAWAKVASRAEKAVDAARASDADLESLRAEMVTWREAFSTARGENTVPIKSLREQIAALGPEPADGAVESDSAATQRKALQGQLSLLETPVLAADIAFARANAIIEGIDGLLRSRQNDSFFTMGPSPAAPALWPAAFSDVVNTIQSVMRDFRALATSDVRRAELRQSAFPILFFSLIGFVLLLRGRAWIIKGGARLTARSKGPGKGVWTFAISIAQVGVPLLGLGALLIALYAAGFGDNRLQYIAIFVLFVGAGFIVARWIGARVFGQPESDWAVLNLAPATRIEGRFDAVILGIVYGVYGALGKVAQAENYSAETIAVLNTPVVILGGVLVFRLGRLLLAYGGQASEESEEVAGFTSRTVKIGARWLKIIGVVGPLLVLLGYGTLGEHLLFATMLSLALIGVLLALHVFYVDLFGLLMKRSTQDAQDALLPVLVSGVTLLLSVPVFALIWGVRATELSEIWARVGEGVSFGEGVIKPTDLLWMIVVFVIGYGATRLIQGMLKTTVLPKTKMDIGGRNAITAGIGYVGYFLAALFAVTAAGINLSSLAIVAGALSVGIGFGLQNIVSNFVSGIILLIERPISEGDWIEAGGQMGFVKDISVRSTRIETFDRTDVVVPNSDLISGVVTNYTRGNKIGRVIIPVGVAYGTDTRRVAAILLEIIKAHPLVVVNPEPAVLFTEFGADSLNFEVRAILSDVNFKLSVHSEINHEIARRFLEEDIEIPFAQRDVWLRNPEALRGEEAAKPAPVQHQIDSAQDPTLTRDDAVDLGEGADQSDES